MADNRDIDPKNSGRNEEEEAERLSAEQRSNSSNGDNASLAQVQGNQPYNDLLYGGLEELSDDTESINEEDVVIPNGGSTELSEDTESSNVEEDANLSNVVIPNDGSVELSDDTDSAEETAEALFEEQCRNRSNDFGDL